MLVNEYKIQFEEKGRMLIMNTEFKTLDGAVGEYYYKHGDDYVDQYGEAIYPATSLPPQTEIVTRIVTREETITETEEYTEF